ncbi:hypothetical protein GCM10008018_36570 [Paenibacillus marchantiophytorum]|uniref:Uncharacterized protein n=2 Tax=Paenibacillus marchantiophytorum TaxID=1619310 RepID=A0ABQ1ETU7_9BACL|nr:hypothetical protein GCM10008018_36570 [Paenibacillus marchantiophytorum]
MQTTSELSPPAQVTKPVAQQKLDKMKFMNINEQDIIDMLSFYKKDGLTEDKPLPEALTHQNSLSAGFSVALFGKSTHQLTRAVANIDMSSDAAVVYTGRFLKGLFHEEKALKEAMAWTSAQLKDLKKGSTNKGEIYIDGKYLQIINLTVNDGVVLSISAE